MELGFVVPQWEIMALAVHRWSRYEWLSLVYLQPICFHIQAVPHKQGQILCELNF